MKEEAKTIEAPEEWECVVEEAEKEASEPSSDTPDSSDSTTGYTRVQAIKERLHELNPEAIVYDGLDDALIGIGERCSMEPVAVYSVDRIHQIHMNDGMTEEEAIEFYDYNIAGGWLGEHTPILVDTYEPYEDL